MMLPAVTLLGIDPNAITLVVVAHVFGRLVLRRPRRERLPDGLGLASA